MHHILRGLPLTTPVETVLNRSSENPVSDTINLIARLVDMVQTRIGGGGRMTNFGFHTGASAHYLSIGSPHVQVKTVRLLSGKVCSIIPQGLLVDQYQNWIFAVNEDEGRYLEEKLITFERWRRCPTFRFINFHGLLRRKCGFEHLVECDIFVAVVR